MSDRETNALGQLECTDSSVICALLDVFKDDDSGVRWSAAVVLAQNHLIQSDLFSMMELALERMAII